MVLENRVNLSILLSALSLNPKEVDEDTKKMILECSFHCKIWWLEYSFMDQLEIDASEIDNHDKIEFCRRLLVLFMDLNIWSKDYKLGPVVFAGFDNNSENDDENICASIINLMLKYESERYSFAGLVKCPVSPGFFLSKYHALVDSYWGMVEKPVHRECPGKAGVVELLNILRS